MPSFDIVSEVDLHQFTNAVDQAQRVIDNRFDFKGVDAAFKREELGVTMFAEADFQLSQMEDMLRAALQDAYDGLSTFDYPKIHNMLHFAPPAHR